MAYQLQIYFFLNWQLTSTRNRLHLLHLICQDVRQFDKNISTLYSLIFACPATLLFANVWTHVQADVLSDIDAPAVETNPHLQDSVSNLKEHRIYLSETTNMTYQLECKGTFLKQHMTNQLQIYFFLHCQPTSTGNKMHLLDLICQDVCQFDKNISTLYFLLFACPATYCLLTFGLMCRPMAVQTQMILLWRPILIYKTV